MTNKLKPVAWRSWYESSNNFVIWQQKPVMHKVEELYKASDVKAAIKQAYRDGVAAGRHQVFSQ